VIVHDEQKLDDDAELVRAALALEQFEIRLGDVPLTNSGLRPASFYAGQSHPARSAEKAEDAAKTHSAPERVAADQPQMDYQLRSGLRGDTGRPSQPRSRAAIGPHTRRCNVCRHPDRKAIEHEFLRWRSPDKIAREYGIPDHSSIYRHVHATGIFARRRRAVRVALESVIECAEIVKVTASSVIKAVHAYTHINEFGEWIKHPTKHIVIVQHQNASGENAHSVPNSPIAVHCHPACPDEGRERSEGSALAFSVPLEPTANTESAKLNRQTQEVEHAPTH
jgi:hypothetical protein